MKSRSHPLNPNAPEHRRNRCSGRFWLFTGFAAALAMASVLALQPVHALQISAVKRDRVVYLQRVFPGEQFSTGYVHSVELSPVREFYRLDQDYRMILTQTTFRSSNVGLPYAAFGREIFHTEADGFRITNMHRVIPRLLIWADRSYQNRLQLKDQDLALYDFAGNTLIEVQIETLCLSRYLTGKAMVWMERRMPS
jgi:hypothetical protein